jgi:hypothetical protein
MKSQYLKPSVRLLVFLLVLLPPIRPLPTASSDAAAADQPYHQAHAVPTSGLAIAEIMYNPSGGQEYEFLELKNVGNATLDLGGAAFVAGIGFTFPPGWRLGPGAFAVLVGDAVAFATRHPGVPIDGVYSGRLDNAGERVALQSAGGAILIDVTYDDDPPWPASADGLGYSLVLADVNGDPNRASSWRASSAPNGSPGRDDPAPLPRTVVINEVLAHSDPPYEDAIELLNTSGSPIDIGGWFLSDSAANLRKYRIPNGVVVPPQGYAVFYEYQFNPTPGSTPSFGLSSLGDHLHLSAANPDSSLTGYFDSLAFGPTAGNTSLGRHVTSVGIDYPALLRPTFGVDDPASLQVFRSGAGASNTGPRIGPVIINELHYHPPAGGDEFVELYNLSGSAVPLYDPLSTTNTWRMTQGISFTFPIDTVMPAQSYLLLVAIDPAQFRATYGIPASIPIFGPYGGSLSNAGEWIELSRPDEANQGNVPFIVVDSILYDDDAPWPVEPDGAGPSLERVQALSYGNEPAHWAASTVQGGTPGRRNSVTPNLSHTTYLPMIRR